MHCFVGVIVEHDKEEGTDVRLNRVERQLEPFADYSDYHTDAACVWRDGVPCKLVEGKSVPDLPKQYIECDLCRAHGTMRAMLGVHAEWDWWLLGGRFNGRLVGNPEPLDARFIGWYPDGSPEAEALEARWRKHEDLQVWLDANTLPAGELTAQHGLDVLVTPDFGWIASGACEADFGPRLGPRSPEEWLATLGSVRTQYGVGHVVVGIDAHL